MKSSGGSPTCSFIWFLEGMQNQSLMCVFLLAVWTYSYLSMHENSVVVFLKLTNISLINTLQGQEVTCDFFFNSLSKHGCYYPKHRTRHWNTQTPRGSKIPLLSLHLISSDSNQATDGSVIIIHVVNHLLLQKNYFPCCPTPFSSQT